MKRFGVLKNASKYLIQSRFLIWPNMTNIPLCARSEN